MRRWFHEPLLLFALMGGALFALDAAGSDTKEQRPPEVPRRIVVDAEIAGTLRSQFVRDKAREPTAEELERLIDGWIQTEVLYREGLARGLAEDDPIVRQRVAAKMAFVTESQLVLPEPSDAELRSWFERHPERWRTPELFDFTHVFFAGERSQARARAAEALSEIERGADAATLGDRFSGGRRYRRRKLDDLARSFGDGFASELAAQAVGSWAIRGSRFGVHVVRIDARAPARAPDFASARADVEKDWKEARQGDDYARAVARLRERWEIERR
jgi:hypothetical protein